MPEEERSLTILSRLEVEQRKLTEWLAKIRGDLELFKEKQRQLLEEVRRLEESGEE